MARPLATALWLRPSPTPHLPEEGEARINFYQRGLWLSPTTSYAPATSYAPVTSYASALTRQPSPSSEHGHLGSNKKGLCPPSPVFLCLLSPFLVPFFICLLSSFLVPVLRPSVPAPAPTATGARSHNRGRQLTHSHTCGQTRSVHQHGPSHDHVHLGHLHLHVRAPEPAV